MTPHRLLVVLLKLAGAYLFATVLLHSVELFIFSLLLGEGEDQAKGLIGLLLSIGAPALLFLLAENIAGWANLGSDSLRPESESDMVSSIRFSDQQLVRFAVLCVGLYLIVNFSIDAIEKLYKALVEDSVALVSLDRAQVGFSFLKAAVGFWLCQNRDKFAALFLEEPVRPDPTKIVRPKADPTGQSEA